MTHVYDYINGPLYVYIHIYLCVYICSPPIHAHTHAHEKTCKRPTQQVHSKKSGWSERPPSYTDRILFHALPDATPRLAIMGYEART